jgi:uncharacterized protein (DUF488 family)
MQVFTIGYEGADIETFVACLVDAQIRVIVDVRELPLSRKKGFSKSALSYALSLEGILYVHLPRLGSPRDVRRAYWESGDWAEFSDAFLQHLAGERGALDQALAEVVLGGACLLCFEADHTKCHRSMVADALKALLEGDLEIVHLPSPRKEVGLFAQMP